jgi:hypothetical protein
MINYEMILRQFVHLVFVMEARGKMAPTPWNDLVITAKMYQVLQSLGWKPAVKGLMSRCLSFDLPGGSKAYIGNGDYAGKNHNSWFGLIEGTMATLFFQRPIAEFGPLADSEMDISEVWARVSDPRSLPELLADEGQSTHFQLRPRT